MIRKTLSIILLSLFVGNTCFALVTTREGVNTIEGPNGKVVTVTTDGSKERLDVNAEVTIGDTSVVPVGDPIHAFNDAIPGSHPATLASHTVNTGKIFHIFQWAVNTQGAIFDAELQVAGVVKDGLRQDNSAFTNAGTNRRDFNPIPIKATAGQVVRIQTVSGDNNKNFLSIIIGIEVDV